MTNHHTKLEDPWTMSSLVIDRTMFVNGPTNIICKDIYIPSFSKGGILMKGGLIHLKYPANMFI